MLKLKNKLVIAFLLFAIFGYSNSLAASDPNNSYTYIDCENGSDIGGEPFNPSKPYLSLKKGIEASVAYINQNGLNLGTGNGVSYTGKQFSIFVKGGCVYSASTSPSTSINLDFVGYNDSTLNIAGINGNFFIDNLYFQNARQNVGGISFMNANFWRNDVYGYYFYPYALYNNSYINNGKPIKIINSLINIGTGKQFSYYMSWRSALGGFTIEKSLINTYVNSDYWFRLPVYIKGSKIQVKNSNLDGKKYNVGFAIAGMNYNGYNYGSINLVSNEIDMNGNNFITENWRASYVNNNFKNVGNFTMGSDTTNYKGNTFINNTISSSGAVNITLNDYAMNNLFVNGFTDTRDPDNLKRNFSGSSTQEKGMGWVFRKELGSNTFISDDYRKTYKEATGQDLIESENPIFYIIN